MLHNDKDHQIFFVGGSDMRTTNPRWRTTAVLNCWIAISLHLRLCPTEVPTRW